VRERPLLAVQSQLNIEVVRRQYNSKQVPESVSSTRSHFIDGAKLERRGPQTALDAGVAPVCLTELV
jgi:hypothetical protein